MILKGLIVLLAALLGWVSAPSDLPEAEAGGKQKVRISPASTSAPGVPLLKDWKEKDAPSCVPMAAVTGLIISRPDAIDFALRDRRFVRAKLKKGCASMDFYSGIYVKPSADGMMCEDRDVIQSRAGTSCMIGKFKTLSPGK